jgi:O-antigen/teichoic acid export membrane protein
VLIPSLLFYLLASNLLVGVGLVRQFNAFQFCNTVLILLFMLAAALVRRDVLGFVIATTLANLLTAAALFLVLRRVSPRSSLSFDMNLFSSGFSYGAKAYGVTLLGLLVLRGNVFLLEKLNGLTQLGYFSIASQVADAIVILPTSVALVLFPSLVRNSDRAFGQTLRSALIVAGVTGCIVVLAGILIRPAVFIAFGSQFAPAITTTRWILPGVFFLSVATILSQYLAARGFPLGVGIAWSLALCSMVTADVLLIPQHGATGAAMAFSISYFILFIALSFVASQQRAQAAAEVALAAVGNNV